MAIIVFSVYFIILIVFIGISALIFYHIGRYSYIGDASKKVFSVYVMTSFIVVLVSLILLIINQLAI